MIEPPLGKPWLLYALLAGSMTLNVYLLVQGPGDDDDEGVAVHEPAPHPSAAPSADAPVADATTPEADATPEPRQPPPYDRVTAEVEHSLARTFQREMGDDGNALSAVYARLFMWDLDLRRELQAGDGVDVLYTRVEDEWTIEAAMLHSRKLGNTIEAYRWQAPGDAHASYWTPEGTEISYRLVDGPLHDYEQITSLLKDRPSHRGMDFKTPVGTPVYSPQAGKVTRVNWNRQYNGNCVEVRYTDGVVAKFLHLDDVLVSEGQTLAAGEQMALSGNTGRSTAPHLHYELAKRGRTLDPIDYHGTRRRQLSDSDREAMLAATAGLRQILDGPAVAQR